MTPETRTQLQEFALDEIKQELLSRAAPIQAMIAADLARAKKDLAGNAKLALFSSADLAESLREQQKAIYGIDNRKDLFEVTNEIVRRNSESVVALFRANEISDNADGSSTLQVGSFGRLNNLCPNEPFFDQPVGAFCTGFLVAPDIIATAGHCVNESNATTVRFVFGFRMVDANTAQTTVKNEDIYAGIEVVVRKLTEADTDWCLVRLDRPVANHRILALRNSGQIRDNESLYVIGHPCGLPAKFADGSRVRANTKSAFFSANLDTYGGNSGSPVFNAETHEVEGVLVRGSTDFVPVGMCMVSAVCSTNGCEGEDCTRVTEFVNQLP